MSLGSGTLSPVIDVVPAALRACAATVRAVDVSGGLAVGDTGSATLDAALRRFATASGSSGCALSSALLDEADGLVAAAEEYAGVEALLVPRALR